MSEQKEYRSYVLSRIEERMGTDLFRSYLADARVDVDELEPCVEISVGSPFRAQRLQTEFLCDVEHVVSEVLGQHCKLRITTFDADVSPTLFDEQLGSEQYSFFAPALSEMPLKDDVHLMGIAPFTLQPRGETRTRLSYRNIEGMDVDIKAHPDYGLPTANDYDIVTMMESNLAARANMYRTALKYYEAQKAAGKRAEKPEPPERKFRPTLRDIQEFVGEHDPSLGKRSGGKQASLLERRLDRLKNTTTKVRQTGHKRRRVGTFSYISDYRILSETESGYIEQVEIDIPTWIYEGIVESPKPTILTFDDGYKSLKQPMMKFLYRLLRLTVKDQPKTFGLEELHRRSGSRQTLKEFNRDMKKKVAETQEQGFFDWGLSIEGNARKRELIAKPKEHMTENG